MNIIYQGHVATDDSTKIVCTTDSLVINIMIINNLLSNYVFSVYRFTPQKGIHLIPIYEFNLNAGDSVRDIEAYTLHKGEYLQLSSNVPNTSYYISTIQV